MKHFIWKSGPSFFDFLNLHSQICWRRDRLPTPVFLGFPSGSVGKESACNMGHLGLNPGLGRSPGEGKAYPLQYSGLESSMESQRVGHDWVTFTFTFTEYNLYWSLGPSWFQHSGLFFLSQDRMFLGLTNDLAECGCNRDLESKWREKWICKALD